MSHMYYFGIAEDIANRFLQGLQSILENIFGTSVQPLFDDFFSNIGTFLLEVFWNWGITFVNRMFYNVFLIILFLLDLIASVFDIFIGINNIVVDTRSGREDSLFNLIFYSDGVGRAFWGITIIACVLTIAFTIFAVLRSMADLDVKRSVGSVLRLMAKSLLTYLMIPLITMAGLNLSSVTMTSVTNALSGVGSDNDVSVGTFIYTAVAKDAMRTHPITSEEFVIEKAGNVLFSLVYTTINPFGAWFEHMCSQLWTTIMNITNTIYVIADPDVTWEESLLMKGFANHVKTTVGDLDSPKANDMMRELIVADFHKGGSNSGITDLMHHVGLKRMPYIDTGYTYQLVKPFMVHSVIGCIAALCVGIYLFMGAYVFSRKIFETLLLYLVSPFFAATIPLDDGARFKAWREKFIGNIVSGYGVVISARIFLLIIPVIFSNKIQFTKFPFLDDILRLIVLCASASSILKSHTLITQIIGGGSASETEATQLAQKGINMAMAPVQKGARYLGGHFKLAANEIAENTLNFVSDRLNPDLFQKGTSYRGGGSSWVRGQMPNGANISRNSSLNIGGHRANATTPWRRASISRPSIGGHRIASTDSAKSSGMMQTAAPLSSTSGTVAMPSAGGASSIARSRISIGSYKTPQKSGYTVGDTSSGKISGETMPSATGESDARVTGTASAAMGGRSETISTHGNHTTLQHHFSIPENARRSTVVYPSPFYDDYNKTINIEQNTGQAAGYASSSISTNTQSITNVQRENRNYSVSGTYITTNDTPKTLDNYSSHGATSSYGATSSHGATSTYSPSNSYTMPKTSLPSLPPQSQRQQVYYNVFEARPSSQSSPQQSGAKPYNRPLPPTPSYVPKQSAQQWKRPEQRTPVGTSGDFKNK